MIYLLAIISGAAYLGLKVGQAYYEYFTAVEKGEFKVGVKRHGFGSIVKPIVWRVLEKKAALQSRSVGSRLGKFTDRKIAIIKSISQFALVFFIVAVAFGALQLWLDTTTNIELAKASILKIEETQFKIKEFVGHFKMGFGYDILILIILISAGGAFPFVEKYKLKSRLKNFSKVVKGILYFLTISTSFTFFGNRFAENEQGRVGDLEFHKLQIIEGNKLLLQQIHEEVSARVVNEILENQDVSPVLNGIEGIVRNIQVSKEDDDYKYYARSATPQILESLPSSRFESNFGKNYDLVEIFKNAENRFSDLHKQAGASNGDFYKEKSEKDYTEFKAKDGQFPEEKVLSADSLQQRGKAFSEGKKSAPFNHSKYYERYKEPIDKLIKKGCTETFAKWVKNFFEVVGIDWPFLAEFIDPIINEPVEDFITQKTETIFKRCAEGDDKAVVKELGQVEAEFREKFGMKVGTNEKFGRIKSQIAVETSKSQEAATLSKNKIRENIQNSDLYLVKISSKSRWELIRQSFTKRLEYLQDLDDFSPDQIDEFKSQIAKWEAYKADQRLRWYINSVNDIENEFFNFSKGDGGLKACWGFVLQQQDWEGAVAYYKKHPDRNAMGKPYYLLKYYYNSIGKGNQFENLYDNSTEVGVGGLCPH